MYFKKKKFCIAILASTLTLSLIGINHSQLVNAAEATSITYPFRTGEGALINSPTVKAPTEQASADNWLWHEQIFDSSKDLTSASYIAVEFKNTVGNPGLTLGVMSNGTRFGTYTDGKPVYFVKQDGSVANLSVLYGSVNLGNDAGTILLPLSSLSIVGWGDQTQTLSGASSFFIETNQVYNWGFEFMIGEVGYYTGDPFDGGTFTKLLDLSKQIKTNKTYDSNLTTSFPDVAIDADDLGAKKVAFPFRKDEDAFKNSPTVAAPSASSAGDNFLYYEHHFDAAVDLTSASYVAIEYKNVTGNPGLTFGVISQGQRFGTYTDGQPAYFVKEDGSVTELSVLYGSLNIGTEPGMVLIPLSSLSLVSWGAQGSTLASAAAIWIETNQKYNWNFSIMFGELGYYTGNPFKGGEFTKTLDLSSKVKKDKIYNAGFDVTFPESTLTDVNIAGQTAPYPFRTGKDAYKDSMIWVGTANGDSSDNWQTMRVKFDEVADLTKASYLAVEYFAKAGTPGLTYGVENKGTRHSIVGSSGEDVYLMNHEGQISKISTITFDASNVGQSGSLLIPIKFLKKQFGDDANTLAAAEQFVLSTNSKYNWAFEVGIGEIGYYTGRPQDGNFEFHKLVDLSNGPTASNYSVVADNTANASTMYRYIIERTVYGDTVINYTATGKTNNSLGVWDGGAAGEQTMTKDTYGDDALKLECTGARPGADAYTAFTLIDGANIDWAGKKGVSLWARNDSDVEVSFNLEIDVVSTKTNVRARFNVTQGNRFWLYDVNTGKQTIYMTRPCVTLPVGFEGWVRIPFEAFAQAQWSIDGAGAFQREFFMTEGCTVPYMCITVFSGSYTNKPFSVNKIGGYATTPSFVSALVPADENRKDIPALMELEPLNG